jgi:DNA-binding transcriptional regulator YdaS (Cro superfamily)
MNDFPYLLVRAARSLGTMLAVATLLGEEPRQVYRWIAGVDVPAPERVGQLTERLLTVV